MNAAQLPLYLTQDQADAAAYWARYEVKKWAVHVSKGRRYRRTFYASARASAGAIKAVQRDAIGLPKGAQYTARLAGPSELGCVRTTGELT